MKSLLPSLPPPAWKSLPGPDLRIETRRHRRALFESGRRERISRSPVVFAGTSTAVRNKESSRRRVQLAPSVRSIRTMRGWPREVATGSQHSIAKLGSSRRVRAGCLLRTQVWRSLRTRMKNKSVRRVRSKSQVICKSSKRVQAGEPPGPPVCRPGGSKGAKSIPDLSSSGFISSARRGRRIRPPNCPTQNSYRWNLTPVILFDGGRGGRI